VTLPIDSPEQKSCTKTAIMQIRSYPCSNAIRRSSAISEAV